MFYNKQLEVTIGHEGFYFWDNKFVEKLDAGFHVKRGFREYKGKLFILSKYSRQLEIKNQQILTKDNITVRISLVGSYQIVDGEKLITQFTHAHDYGNIYFCVEEYIRNALQLCVRDFMSQHESSALAQGEVNLQELDVEKVNDELADVGICIEGFAVKDIGFAKKIQELFAHKLESKLRAETDLENARTAVATTRTLKNASKMFKDDENVKFLHYLETLTKISNKGNHNFHFGEKVLG